MRIEWLSVYVLLVTVGCGSQPSPAPGTPTATPPAPATSAAPSPQALPSTAIDVTRPFDPKDAQWRIPVPDAKPPVLASDYELVARDEGAATDEAKARALLRQGDLRKSSGQYIGAEESYRAALAADPALAQAAYQLACNYALWGKEEQAHATFADALERGFCDYPVALRDEELGTIRAAKEFSTQLVRIRERYLGKSAELVGTPVVVPAATNRPDSGWPIMLLLHGYGDTHESYLPEAIAWSKLGFTAVAVPGSIPNVDGGFIWSQDEVEITHLQLQAIVKHALLNDADRQRVFVLGFSQGAMHALQIAVLHADDYSGTVPIGPGGQPWVLGDEIPGSSQPRRAWFVAGRQEGTQRFVESIARILERDRWQARVQIHPGGHQFPEDWGTKRGEAAAFLLGK